MMLRRHVVIVVDALVDERLTLAPQFCAALREYADAVEQGKAGNTDTDSYLTNAGPRIKVVHGVDELP